MGGQTGGVRANDGAGGQHLFQLDVKLMLDIQPLYYGLDNPIDVGEFLKVIFNIAHGYQTGRALTIKGSWPRFEGFFQTGTSHFIAIFSSVGGYDIEQQARDTDVSEMGSYCRSHHTCTQDCRFTNLVCHSYASLSIIVARPWPPPMQRVAIP